MNQIHAYTNANNANIDALSSDDYNLDISKKKIKIYYQMKVLQIKY